ncbi:hypothetical protein C8R44DRAFT_745986 [Mycena epipterygia]|nr:hypothetical protein C8R44DRAFT_745986 [Mycena epipterygia]
MKSSANTEEEIRWKAGVWQPDQNPGGTIPEMNERCIRVRDAEMGNRNRFRDQTAYRDGNLERGTSDVLEHDPESGTSQRWEFKVPVGGRERSVGVDGKGVNAAKTNTLVNGDANGTAPDNNAEEHDTFPGAARKGHDPRRGAHTTRFPRGKRRESSAGEKIQERNRNSAINIITQLRIRVNRGMNGPKRDYREANGRQATRIKLEPKGKQRNANTGKNEIRVSVRRKEKRRTMPGPAREWHQDTSGSYGGESAYRKASIEELAEIRRPSRFAARYRRTCDARWARECSWSSENRRVVNECARRMNNGTYCTSARRCDTTWNASQQYSRRIERAASSIESMGNESTKSEATNANIENKDAGRVFEVGRDSLKTDHGVWRMDGDGQGATDPRKKHPRSEYIFQRFGRPSPLRLRTRRGVENLRVTRTGFRPDPYTGTVLRLRVWVSSNVPAGVSVSILNLKRSRVGETLIVRPRQANRVKQPAKPQLASTLARARS